ncbi:vWA domain-containing protein [Desulfotruncus alcoholivorax]|uniref:vWA domain-containing protein n=1 Tax=Desulfotruncus alcoholivorax TaxID=265477 RepID=UPI00041849CD|nr:VWA domain-containing protein [Desulfotruncus alcoholivorax]
MLLANALMAGDDMSKMGTVFAGKTIEPIAFFERLSKFIAVLRSLGLNTGTSELSDAVRALAEVDVLDRNQFRAALRATLVKKQKDARVFDLAFDRFFAPCEVKDQWRRRETKEAAELEQLMKSSQAEIMDGVSRSGGEWAGGATEQIKLTEDQLETYARLPENERKKIRDLLESYRGNPVNDPSDLIAQVVEASLDYWRYHLNKKEEEQGEARPDYNVSYCGDQEADEIIRLVARDLVGEPEESLLEKDMRAIGEQDMPVVTVLLKKMARRLATGLSRRYRGSRKKQAIDIRRTVRGSIQFGGIPLYLRYRSKRVQKPRLVLVCDVSASMARYARLIIQFIYGLSDVVKDIETFIFSEDLERITPQLERRLGFAQTMSAIMLESGQWGKTTNLAASLWTFINGYQHLLTRNTFFIIVSDTKTLEPENTALLLAEIKKRVKDILWLNTLPRKQWQDVRTVELFGKTVRLLESNTLSQLERSMKRL